MASLCDGVGRNVAMLKLYEPRLENILEQHRCFYVVDPEHGWRLDCDVDEVVRGLKSALRAERENRKLANRKLRRLEALIACTRETRARDSKKSLLCR